MFKIITRKVSLNDISGLLPLVEQLGHPMSIEHLTARVAVFQHNPHDVAWVAIQNDIVVGYVALQICDLFHSTDRYARIISMAIQDNKSHQRIHKRLIQRCEKFAAKKNCTVLEIWCHVPKPEKAKSFYQEMGYEQEEEKLIFLRKKLVKVELNQSRSPKM